MYLPTKQVFETNDLMQLMVHYKYT